jgi:hypothetical protein
LTVVKINTKVSIACKTAAVIKLYVSIGSRYRGISCGNICIGGNRAAVAIHTATNLPRIGCGIKSQTCKGSWTSLSQQAHVCNGTSIISSYNNKIVNCGIVAFDLISVNNATGFVIDPESIQVVYGGFEDKKTKKN